MLRVCTWVADTIRVLTSTEVAGVEGEMGVERLVLKGAGGETTVDADALFLFLGGQPSTEWLPAEVDRDGHGFVVTGAAARAYETSVPGVFAVGDVRSGSTKRVAAGVGEGSVVIAQLHGYLEQQAGRLAPADAVSAAPAPAGA